MLQACLSSTSLKLLARIAAPHRIPPLGGTTADLTAPVSTHVLPWIQRSVNCTPETSQQFRCWESEDINVCFFAVPGLSCGLQGLVPPTGLKPRPLRWEHGALPTGAPGKPWCQHFLRLPMLNLSPILRLFFFFLMSDFKLTLEASLLSSWRKEREP